MVQVMNYFRINGQWYYSESVEGLEPIQARHVHLHARYLADLIYHVAPESSRVTVIKSRDFLPSYTPAPTPKELMQIRLQSVPLPASAFLRGMRQLGKSRTQI